MRCHLHSSVSTAIAAQRKHKRDWLGKKFDSGRRFLRHLLILAVLVVPSVSAFGLIKSTSVKSRIVTMAAEQKSIDAGSNLLVSSLNKLGSPHIEGSSIRLILASQSPRRREILDMMGLSDRYTVNPSPLDESALQKELASKPHLPPEDYAKTLAEQKAQALAVQMLSSTSEADHETTLILGSDTIVDLDGDILEKPVDHTEAHTMLTKLSGNWHKVHTGVAIYGLGIPTHNAKIQHPKLLVSFTETARVKFARLTTEDITSYVNTGEPMDKAGSYGIQGVGGQLVEMIEGDFFTVMGLPMHALSRELSRTMSLLDT